MGWLPQYNPAQDPKNVLRAARVPHSLHQHDYILIFNALAWSQLLYLSLPKVAITPPAQVWTNSSSVVSDLQEYCNTLFVYKPKDSLTKTTVCEIVNIKRMLSTQFWSQVEVWWKPIYEDVKKKCVTFFYLKFQLK